MINFTAIYNQITDDNTFIEDGEVKYIIPPPKDPYLRSVKGTNKLHDMKKPTGRKAYLKSNWQKRKGGAA